MDMGSHTKKLKRKKKHKKPPKDSRENLHCQSVEIRDRVRKLLEDAEQDFNIMKKDK